MRAPERRLLEQVSGLVLANPFLPERRDLEKKLLGRDFVDVGPVFSLTGDPSAPDPNVAAIVARLGPVLERCRSDVSGGVSIDDATWHAYEESVLFLLYHRYGAELDDLSKSGDPTEKSAIYPRFQKDLTRYLSPARPTPPVRWTPAHLFAMFFQLRRAFSRLFEHVIGTSGASARLRASAWQSVFTRDLRRYLAGLHETMQDFTTLITGPSGSGKELVARAIGLSQYVPFDERAQRFVRDPRKSFFALNLSALSPSLVESELFGHAKGAFTGAARDRPGWLEESGAFGTVFLDEIGEIEEGLQVKLLRVLQTRSFQRLGESDDRRFQGKLITATNRDLGAAMEEGRFREDLYYRLCSDMVITPSLHEQLAGAPGDLTEMIRFIVGRIDSGARGARDAGGRSETRFEEIAAEVEGWIRKELGRSYSWPGNFRELEQCVRNVMVRGEYRPRSSRRGADPEDRLIAALAHTALSAEDVLRIHCSTVYAETESFVKTAERLGLDRRTVKNRVDLGLVRKVRGLH